MLSAEEQNWDRAQFLELVPEESKSVVVQLTDMKVVTKESEMKHKLSGSNSLGKGYEHAGKGSYQWIPAKGDNKGGKTKDKDNQSPFHDDQSGKKGGGANKWAKNSTNKNWWGKRQQR